MKKRTVIAGILALAGIICAGVAGYQYYQDRHAGKEYEDLKEKVVKEKQEEEPEEEEKTPLDIPIDFEQLQSMNPEIYAWIRIPGSIIDYPIVQSDTDNAYYLTHDVENKDNAAGAIFTEDYNTKTFEDPNTVIYGHGMTNGTMFNGLHQYMDRSYFDENRDIIIYMPDKILHYKIFAAYEVEIVNCIRESGSAAFMLNPFYRYIKPIRDFLEAAQIISKHAHLINASLECAIHVLYDGIDILGCALGGLSTWKLGNVAESYTTSMAGGGNRVISGIIGMVPVTFIVNTNVDRNDIDHPLHLYHRIELTFSTGRLCLVNTHGPVIWLPFLHMPRDEYGTLSINVEEEVNIPSGVTIGNVMLPSLKETFEQIWPDAVKKALEILFKQNRTEKMSMAQYQIYVSKLWSEICQKVGYMNIVDYDNFGDIKSIFYDLEKRHLIKKENDGIE